jgi:hypothetical protein
MASRINVMWTASEKAALASGCVQRLARQLGVLRHQVSHWDITSYRGFFCEVFNPTMQNVFLTEPARLRSIKQFVQVPWLVQSMLAEIEHIKAQQIQATALAVAEQETAQPVVEAVPTAPAAAIDVDALTVLVAQKVVALLTEQFVLTPKMVMHTKARLPAAPTVVATKPKVWLLGLKPSQFNEVVGVWGQRFDLRLVDSSRTSGKIPVAPGSHVIAMTDFCSHSLLESVRHNQSIAYHPIAGGVTSIKKALNDLNSRMSYTK